MHRLRRLQQQLARSHDEPGIGIANPSGEFVEGACHARMRIGAEQDLSRSSVALLRKSSVADPSVVRTVLALEHALARIKHPMAFRIIDDVVKISYSLFVNEIAQNIDVPV